MLMFLACPYEYHVRRVDYVQTTLLRTAAVVRGGFDDMMALVHVDMFSSQSQSFVYECKLTSVCVPPDIKQGGGLRHGENENRSTFEIAVLVVPWELHAVPTEAAAFVSYYMDCHSATAALRAVRYEVRVPTIPVP